MHNEECKELDCDHDESHDQGSEPCDCDGCDCDCCADCCGGSGEKLGLIDRMLEKAVSRKLIVFLTATGLMAWSDLDPDTWGLVAIVYVGGQSVIDAVKTYKYGDSL
jgi:hypothetical protein